MLLTFSGLESVASSVAGELRLSVLELERTNEWPAAPGSPSSSTARLDEGARASMATA